MVATHSDKAVAILVPRVDILLADDIIFSKVAACLHLNEHHRQLARIFETVFFA